jgi:hypothetical protein
MLERGPFFAFTVETLGGRLFEIDHSEAIVFREGIASFTAPGSIPIWFDHDSVVHIFDCPASDIPYGPHR